MVDIPPWVKGIRPEVITVPLASYSTRGELFSSEDQAERFFSDSWQRWKDVSVRYDTPPHVFIIDFEEVRTLSKAAASNGFAFVLSNTGGERRAHVVFDNLLARGRNNPWESLSSALEHFRLNKVAVARRQGDKEYQLIGNPQITEGRHWQYIFSRLLSARDWVQGPDFIRNYLDLPRALHTLRDHLHEMSKSGLVLQENQGRSAYYRTLV